MAQLHGGRRGCLSGYVRSLWPALFCVLNCWAQPWEIGAGAGYGWYKNGSVMAPAGAASAGIRNRFSLTVFLSEERYDRISGEVRYTYQDGDPFLEAGGEKTNIQGQSHTFHYDVLFHWKDQEQRIRPFVAVGAGAKMFVVTGPANPSAPLQNIAQLTTRDQTRFVVSAGGGVKWKIAERVSLRIELRDYISQFPKRLIAPVPLATARGIFHQITPMICFSYGL